jgi:pimeloyl-ACP methyl ester carboxylesterase
VSGVILDSPVLDFEVAVEFQAREERIPFTPLPPPGTLVDTAEWWAALRFDVDWNYTDYLDRTADLAVPVLLIHGTGDDHAPVATSDEFARERPDLIRDYYRPEGAGHVEAWNANPAEYERRVVAFLEVVERGALQ